MTSVKLTILFIISFIAISNSTFAQWVYTNGPYGATVQALISKSGNMYAATQGGGVYITSNNGLNWTATNSGLSATNIYSLTVIGNNLFAGAYGGCFISTNNGAS